MPRLAMDPDAAAVTMGGPPTNVAGSQEQDIDNEA